MENSSAGHHFELIWVIVNFGLGSKVIKIARQNGITGGTIFLGKGTINNRLLQFLELYEVRKEIVFMIAEDKVAVEVMEKLNSELNFKKPNHGTAFSTSVKNLFGTKNYKPNGIKKSRGVEDTMYNAIFTVVEKGRAEEVIEAATKAGSKGGTIINARGSGIHETNTLFSMAIEPEKEIVMILAEQNITDSIVSSIREQLRIDEPGKGVMFVLEVNKTYGLA